MAAQETASPRKYTVTINYTYPGTQPPIYVAGTFTTPSWEPHELHHTAIKREGGGIQDREYEFHRDFEVEEGRWQYKLRAGLGDWWILDERAATVVDDVGNRNNLLVVGPGNHNIITPSETSQTGELNHGTVTQNFEPTSIYSDVSQRLARPGSDPLHAPEEHSVDHFAGELRHPEPQPARPPPVDDDGNGDTNVSYASPVEEIPLPITVVEKVPDEDAPLYGDIDRESLHEDKQARQADAEPDEMVVLSAPVSNQDSENEASPPEIPLIVVEKTDSTASHGDDMGPEATEGQKLAHAQRAMDAEPDSIIVASNSETLSIPENSGSTDTSQVEIADVVAEVADTAAMLDASPQGSKTSGFQPNKHRESHGNMSEAGEIVAALENSAALADRLKSADNRPEAHQEYSNSPSEIANTAAEADDLNNFASAVGYDQSETESPRLEYGPLLPHERMSDVAAEASQRDSMIQETSLREVQALDDFDDPSLEPFPTDYNGILERIRSTEAHLNEDVVTGHGASVSPVASRPRLPFRGHVSPTVVSDDGQSPVLLSITEASEEDDAKDPGPSPIKLPEAFPATASDSPQGNDEYFVGDEAASTSSRSSRRSTINTRETPPATETIRRCLAMNANGVFGVEDVMQAHALSLRNGRQAGSISDNFALGGEMDHSQYPKSLPEGTTINIQERSASMTPSSRSSEAGHEIAEHENSQEHPYTSVEAVDRVQENGEFGSIEKGHESRLRQRNPVISNYLQDRAAPTVSETMSSEHRSQSVILAFWVALVNWISGLFAKLRG